jgi:fatty acid desaturase
MEMSAGESRTFDQAIPGAASAVEAPVRAPSLAQEARRLTDDLVRPSPAVYWTDLSISAAVVFGGLALAIMGEGALRWIGAAAAVPALYRALSFIHELTHLRDDEVPGFRIAWNALIGVPFLVPSFLYEGVHNVHHLPRCYGTADDPEYLPLARGRRRALLGFVAVAALAPVGSMLRFAVLAPLSLIAPGFRETVVARFSAMVINPAFQRKDVAFARTAAWRAQEAACWLWSWTLIGLATSGGIALRAVLTGAAILSATTVLNQLRTLVAHAWDGDGEPMTLEAQVMDSVNVPPPGWLPLVWAPVGLRYHALHHLAPRVPYHNLAEAHRRLAMELAPGSAYHAAQYGGMGPALRQLFERCVRNSSGA